MFGEINYLNGGGATASIVASTDVQAFVIDVAALDKLFAEKLELAMKFAYSLACNIRNKIVQRETDVVQLTNLSPLQARYYRVAFFEPPHKVQQ